MIKKIKILLADDHSILREGLKIAFKTDSGIEVVGEAGNGVQAIALIKELNPDVVILDIDMPEMNGLEAIEEIKKIDCSIKIIILTMHDTEKYLIDAMNKGVNGYLIKSTGLEELVDTVKSVAAGHDVFGKETSKLLLSKINSRKNDKLFLTNREKEILKYLVQGLTTPEIAEKLFISHFTVSNHRKNILQKLGIKSTAKLIRYAIENGIISGL